MSYKFFGLDGIKQVIKEFSTTPEAGLPLALDDNKQYPSSVFPAGIGEDIIERELAIDITAGRKLVSIVNGKVELADCTVANGTRPAMLYILDGGSAGDIVKVYYTGVLTGLSGLTPDNDYFLSSSGDVSLTPPSDANGVLNTGELYQYVGRSISDTEILINIDRPYIIG